MSPPPKSASPDTTPASATTAAAAEAEDDDGGVLGEQQPRPPDRDGQQVAQRPVVGLARDGSPVTPRRRAAGTAAAGRERREGDEQPVAGDRVEEVRAARRRCPAGDTLRRWRAGPAAPASTGARRLRRRRKTRRSSERRNARRGTPASAGRRPVTSAADIEALPGERHEHVLQTTGVNTGTQSRAPRGARAPPRPSRRHLADDPQRHVAVGEPDVGQSRACAASAAASSGRSVSTRAVCAVLRGAARRGPWATSLPSYITPTWLHICSTSLSRWLETSTVVPPSASDSTRVPHLAGALRVEPVGRLVEHQQVARASSALAMASRWRMPSE